MQLAIPIGRRTRVADCRFRPVTTDIPAPPAVETRGLSRRFGNRVALEGIDISVSAGECLAIFGPNGAGKTTLLRVLAGLLHPTTGTVRIGGETLAGAGGVAARADIGFISHQTMLYPALTARENVEFTARLYGIPAPRGATEVSLARLHMLEHADSPVRALSRGLKQRVSIARAFVHTPRVVLLDEPYTSLDALGAADLSTTLAGLKASGAALVLVTHHLEEGLALANWVGVMRSGHFVRMDRRDKVDASTYAGDYRELVAGEG
jgi:heme exporter protein A